jgi:GTP-binding protein HflX
MKRLSGNTGGLKANQLRRLENFYRRRTPPEYLVTPEITRDLARLSHELRRQIGLLLDRRGKIVKVIVGDQNGIVIPAARAYRVAPGRLKGLRCIHTHLKREALTMDDLTDLALLRLDAMAAITFNADGLPHQIHLAHILPQGTPDAPYRIWAPLRPLELDIGCHELIRALESEMAHLRRLYQSGQKRERALLVSVSAAPKLAALESLDELKDLSASGGIEVIDTLLQQRSKVDSRLLLGRGKLKDLTILALQKGITLIIFDQELNPSQIRTITDQIDLKVVDRTQLILDIFAQRAQTREGKLQVELAQLRYLLPRLVTKNTAMSRLTGGIGGRGPGETKLEINRRRMRTRIAHLEKALERVRQHRRQQRAQRERNALPVVSIIGYTNAGKSTLLNTLTHSKVLAGNRLFATLDPSSRRLRFPRDLEVLITDTVGFIRNLPRDLQVAFRATLEELENADLLLHVIDISNPRFQNQIASVEAILGDLKLQHIPMIRVLNKQDRLDPQTVQALCHTWNGMAISALDRSTLRPLIDRMQRQVLSQMPAAASAPN